MTSLELLNLTIEQKMKGVWIEGNEKNGEYMEWHGNGILYWNYFVKDSRLNGEYKSYNTDGKLMNNRIYKDGKLIKDYLQYENL